MATITLMTGANAFLLRQEKRRWIEEFSKKYGDDTVVRLDAKGLTIRHLLDEVGVMPFLAEKRLVIVDGIPKATKEEMQALEAAIHPSTVLLFCDGSPDKRLTGVKALMDMATVKTFAEVKGQKLLPWIEAIATQEGLRMGPGVALRMIELLGSDQDALLTEIQKLALGFQGKTLTVDDVNQYTIPADEGVVWTMTDLLAAGNTKAAMAYTQLLLERGGDTYGLWAILLSMLKNVVLVRAALDDGLSNPRDIGERTGVHPFALRSLQPFAKRLTHEQIADLVAWAAETDTRLKTGGYRSTDESPQELHALIDRFLSQVPSAR